ncbi:MAG TPA: dihydrofolate reductase [Lacipirellulaceae bacterium]|jgi:dihydrofolate reductase|nr:dihydrofolate reductase [Lacipirellulaceae bacterium]
MRISIIVAAAENGVIGREGDLPWRLSADLQRFKRLTMGHTIIMGRRTWESIGRPLPGRRTIVVSRQPNYRTGVADVTTAASLVDALQLAAASGDEEAFVIGGAELYREGLQRADRLHVTRVRANVEGDTYFPDVEWNQWQFISGEEHAADDRNDHTYAFEIYERT